MLVILKYSPTLILYIKFTCNYSSTSLVVSNSCVKMSLILKMITEAHSGVQLAAFYFEKGWNIATASAFSKIIAKII